MLSLREVGREREKERERRVVIGHLTPSSFISSFSMRNQEEPGRDSGGMSLIYLDMAVENT